jgi:hypothetical protein
MENATAGVGFAAVWVGPELAYGRQNRPDPGGQRNVQNNYINLLTGTGLSAKLCAHTVNTNYIKRKV